MRRRSVSDRFWSRVDRSAGPDGCWLWRGFLNRTGYGVFCVTRPGSIGAHRLAWDLINGPIPAGLCVLHRCDVRNCVNPSHLFLGTQADNVADMYAKGRQSPAHIRTAGLLRSVCKYGHERSAGSGKPCPTCRRLYLREYRRLRYLGGRSPAIDMAAVVAASKSKGPESLDSEPSVLRRAGVSVSTAESAPVGAPSSM